MGYVTAYPTNPSQPTQGGPVDPWKYPGELGPYRSILPSPLYRRPGSGDSPWLQLAKQNQLQDQSQVQAGASKKAATDAQTAQNRLAMTRGLSSGAQERLASEGAQNASNLWAQIGSEGQTARNNLALQDEDWNRANQRIDYQSQLQDKLGANAYDLAKYQSQLQAWGAGQQAKAQENAGKK